MIRANIVLKGEVQRVGFRTFIKNIADSLNSNLEGFAENLPDGDLKIVCEGEKDIKQEDPDCYTHLFQIDGGAFGQHGALFINHACMPKKPKSIKI